MVEITEYPPEAKGGHPVSDTRHGSAAQLPVSAIAVKAECMCSDTSGYDPVLVAIQPLQSKFRDV